MAALLAGSGVEEVAEQYKIPANTVWEWKRHAASVSEVVQSEKTAELGDLIADYLRETLATLTVQVQQFRDTDWLKKQPASEAAVLHGVLMDKAIRILSALENAGDADAGGTHAP